MPKRRLPLRGTPSIMSVPFPSPSGAACAASWLPGPIAGNPYSIHGCCSYLQTVCAWMLSLRRNCLVLGNNTLLYLSQKRQFQGGSACIVDHLLESFKLSLRPKKGSRWSDGNESLVDLLSPLHFHGGRCRRTSTLMHCSVMC